MTLPTPGRLALVAALALAAGAATAQTDPLDVTQPRAQGVAYSSFAEPGAPTVEVVFLGEGIRNGIFVFQEGTSLLRALALAGGMARTDSTDRAILSASIRVLRPGPGGEVQMLYEAPPERLVREPARHPELRTGDIIESEITFEAVPERFTFLDGLNVASRVASVVSLVLLLVGLR